MEQGQPLEGKFALKLRLRKPLYWVLGVFAAVYAAVTAYGWWHTSTRATFAVQLIYRADSNIGNRLRNGQLSFLDADGRVLSRASIDTRRNTVWLAHPEKGQCGPLLDMNNYRDCFAAQTVWVPLWAEAVRFADIALEDCNLGHVHVNVHTQRDGILLWWLPRINESTLPYKRHRAALVVDVKRCGAQ